MDNLQRFMFESAAVRGEIVEIKDAWSQIQARQTYPLAVQKLLGEMVAAGALLSANLKFDGTLILQVHGSGPVRLLVVECDSNLKLRATAKLDSAAEIAPDASLTDLLNPDGQGRFAITLDPNEKLPGQQPYQGIVRLDGESLATVIENYMMRSEQLDTKLWLASNESVTRGLLLQKLPREGGFEAQDDGESWNHTVMLASTLKEEEMLATDSETLLRRLFWEESVRVFEPRQPSFYCSCNREKVGGMLKMLGVDEVESALTEMDKLEINCDFCGQAYTFDAVDCAQLFAADTTSDGVQSAPKTQQ